MTDRTTVSFASAVALWIVAVVATVFLLRAATTLLIPIALAVLVSYALAPVVSWLEDHRVPRLAGAGLVLLQR
jgi:predicted PurR-regulated permease PerM